MIKLPYFKAFTSEYLASDIAFLDYKLQGIYHYICYYYWNENCQLSVQKLSRRIHQSDFQVLIDEDIIEEKNGQLCIKYLDKQFDELQKIRKAQSSGGKKRRASQKTSDLKVTSKSEESENVYIDKEEDKEEDKRVKKQTHKQKVKSFYKQQVEEYAEEIYIDRYKNFVNYLFGQNELKKELTTCLRFEDHVTYPQFTEILSREYNTNKTINEVLLALEDWGNPKKRKILYRNILQFMRND